MSDAGSTKFPDGPKLPGSTNRTANQTVLNASLIGVPNATRGAENKIVKLQGQVLNQTDNGRVRIQTPKGPVEIQLPKDSPQRQAPLQRGQNVEIEIPPEKVRNRNPESVQIRTEPRESQRPNNTTQTTERNERTARKDNAEQNVTRSRIDNIRLDNGLAAKVREAAPAPEIKTPTALPVKTLEGASVRLDPLPPNQFSQIIVPDVETLQNTLTQRAIVLEQIVQTQIQTEQIQNLIKTNAPTENAIQNQPVTPQTVQITAPQSVPSSQPAQPQPQSLRNTAQVIVNTKNNLSINNTIAIPNTDAALQTFGSYKSASFSADIQSVKSPNLTLIAPNGAQQTQNTASTITQTNAAQTNITQNQLAVTQNQIGVRTGTIIGSTAAQLPVLNIPSLGVPNGQGQNFILQVPVQDAALGTRIEISAQGAQNINVGASMVAGALPPLSYFLTPDNWPLMQDILHSLRSASPPTAQAFSASMPNAANAPSQMGPAALFVMAALRGGDLSNILSDKAQEILRGQGKGNLISRMTQEGGIINRLNAEAPSSDWRSMTLPMAWENEIHKVALHYKHDQPENGDDNKGGKQTRFIFDLSLNRMGKVQVDGLHRDNRLNLILRTEQPLSRSMQITMKDGYNSALDGTTLNGDLSFQNNLDGWVKVNATKEDQFAADI